MGNKWHVLNGGLGPNGESRKEESECTAFFDKGGLPVQRMAYHTRTHLFTRWQDNISFESQIKGDERPGWKGTMGMKVFRLCSNSGPVKTPRRRLCTLDSTDQRPSAWFCSSQSDITRRGGARRRNHCRVPAASCLSLKQSLEAGDRPCLIGLLPREASSSFVCLASGENFQNLNNLKHAYLEPLPTGKVLVLVQD